MQCSFSTTFTRADNVLADFNTLTNLSTSIYNSLSSDKQAAFFELIHHPVLATHTLAQMWISSGVSALRASQARVSANQYADDVETLFEQDYALEQQYHQLLDGKR